MASSWCSGRPERPCRPTGVIVYPGAGLRRARLLHRCCAGWRTGATSSSPCRCPSTWRSSAPNRADDVRAAFPDVRALGDCRPFHGRRDGGALRPRSSRRPGGPHPLGLAARRERHSGGREVSRVAHPPGHGRRPCRRRSSSSYRNLFPATSTWVPVPGGIHMYFGSFVGGGYKEEWTPTISREAQQDLRGHRHAERAAGDDSELGTCLICALRK